MSFNHIFFEPASHTFLAGHETPAHPRHHGRHGHHDHHGFHPERQFMRYGLRDATSPPPPPPPFHLARGHSGHHGHHGHHPRDRQFHRPSTPPSDYDEQERALIQQLEALRVRKSAYAQAEAQRKAAAAQEEVNRAQQVAAMESARQQRLQTRIEAQLQHQARQQALIRALSLARVEAQQIERQQQRERQARLALAQQVYLAQQQTRAEEERQRRFDIEKRKQIEAAQRQKMIQDTESERQFWQTIERAFTPSQAAHLHEWQGQASFKPTAAPASQPMTTPAPKPAAETFINPEQKDFVDVLKLIFGDDVEIRSTPKDDKKPEVGNTATPVTSTPQPPTQAPKSATPSEDKSTAPPKTDSTEAFIDELFGAFASAFGLNQDKDQYERKPEDKSESTTEGAPVDANTQTSPVASTTVESTQEPTIEEPSSQRSATPQPETILKPESRPASTIPQSAGPATPPSKAEEEIPISAADLEAQQAQATADLIQARYRQHLLRVKRLEKLETLENKLEKLDDGWSFPTKLDFLPSSRSGDTTELNSPHLDPVDSASSNSENLVVPPLAFTPLNVPYHSHAQSLLGLLVSADGISSDGDEQVRSARKDFVRKVEGKLGEMEIGRRAVWEKVREVEVVPEVQLDAPATAATTAATVNDTTTEAFESTEDSSTTTKEQKVPVIESDSAATTTIPAPTVEDVEDNKTFSDSEDEERKPLDDGDFVMM